MDLTLGLLSAVLHSRHFIHEKWFTLCSPRSTSGKSGTLHIAENGGIPEGHDKQEKPFGFLDNMNDNLSGS